MKFMTAPQQMKNRSSQKGNPDKEKQKGFVEGSE